jgi:3-deoxy-D-manno-octulosonic-acid transferase
MHNRLIYLVYQLISSAAGVAAWPYFYWHLKSRGRGESFLPRLGLKLPAGPPPPGQPRIWLHGVSVGEALAALPLARELREHLPRAALVVTTGTETGQAVARKNFAPLDAFVCYFPLDIPWAVSRYLEFLQPQVFVGLESELWPNFLVQARRRGVRLALMNARVSPPSLRRFIKFKRYSIDIFNLFDVIAASTPQDYSRLRALGLAPPRLSLGGNLKCDRLFQDRDEAKVAHFRRLLQAPRGAPVFLAASTHRGEEAAVLQAYARLQPASPTLLLLLAPRHPERAPEVLSIVRGHGLSAHLFSRLKSGQETRSLPVVVIDTMGDLFHLYGLAELAFVGGSLIPHGGQNLLEPAAWGLAPFYGPHLDNFRWAQAILEGAGAGVPVQNADSLAAAALDFLKHPEARRRLGERARAALVPHQGAARRQARLVLELLPGDSGAHAAGSSP